MFSCRVISIMRRAIALRGLSSLAKLRGTWQPPQLTPRASTKWRISTSNCGTSSPFSTVMFGLSATVGWGGGEACAHAGGRRQQHGQRPPSPPMAHGERPLIAHTAAPAELFGIAAPWWQV